MALDGDTCGEAVAAALASGSETPVQLTEMETKWKAAMNAIFTHITSNAEVKNVLTNVAVASVSGVTPGGGVSGPGTGTGTQTGFGSIS